MKKTLDWYFDFLSPFSYLQGERLDQIGAHADVRCRPVVFAGLLNHWGQKGPAEIATKRQWIFEQVVWQARAHGIALKMPVAHPFNPLPPLRLALALGSGKDVVQRIFRFVWRDGHLPDDAAHWNALLDELGATPDMLDSPAVKAALHANGAAAIDAGVFGVPTSVVDGRRFWGFDATPMLIDYLQGDAFFDSAEFAAAAQLPWGSAVRKVKA